jgi:hypothetical protein
MRPELAAIDVESIHGLEIGPLASPRVRKDEGPVRYVDHATAAELKEKYATDVSNRGAQDMYSWSTQPVEDKYLSWVWRLGALAYEPVRQPKSAARP